MSNENKTLLFHPDEEGLPMLLGFHRYGHDKDYVLSGRQAFGRQTGEEGEPEIAAPSLVVSREHGEFGTVENQSFYRDTGSSNGTYVNRQRCEATHVLQDGDVLSVMSRKNSDGIPEYLMIFTRAEQTGFQWEKIQLGEEIQEISIGRGCGGLQMEDAYISEHHASFFHASEGWSILDFGSTNGVYVNHKKLEGCTLLKPMDVIRMGTTWFVYQGKDLWVGRKISSARQHTDHQLVIDIQERNVWSRFKKKTLLRDIHLTVEPGDFVLILGGSGAGKTTFMNAVMGYEKAEGTVRYGDINIYEEYEQIKYNIGFVPQQDTMRMNDTVYKVLFGAAQMKVHDMEECGERTDWAISLLGLEREQNTLVGKLSGGQKKRLSIAMELVGDPALFFLDEPDSGLDGIMARELMENLKEIADMGKMVMIITHGPDRAADLFTKVLVLAKSEEDNSGHLVFYGNIPPAKDYFETDSLEGIVRRINRKDEGGDGLADYYIKKGEE